MTASDCTAQQTRLQGLGRQAVRALYAEVALEPKPGLVSFRDCGSHTDMTATTFVRSLFALRHYFPALARAGFAGAPFARLENLGRNAEARMLQATGGINTHRGAVFGLGLLCASAGHVVALGQPITAQHLRQALAQQWGDALVRRAADARSRPPTSHGQRAAKHVGLRTASDEAALGFPTLFDTTLPALLNACNADVPPRAAKVQAMFATMAVLDDTNVAHRGGQAGLELVRRRALQFLEHGGVWHPDWLDHARAIHAELVSHRLSPGGSADVLASACWVQAVVSAPTQLAKRLQAPALQHAPV
ncbi:MAG: triphosphoribosyl-dephospho-CoA synthase MdcB [Candidatus Saccharibacteria bacterium]|nr:triphosphoribosyl-dephospho-CoA synthase MdcB [Rhodoferax sp.]